MYATIGTFLAFGLLILFGTIWAVCLLHSVVWAFLYYADNEERSITFLKKDTIWEKLVITNRGIVSDYRYLELDTLAALTWILPVIPAILALVSKFLWPAYIVAALMWFVFYIVRTMFDVRKMLVSKR
jgi:hypothetical protein